MIEWRPIAGYEGAYEVSSDGRVRSLDRWVQSRAALIRRRGKQLTPGDADGYQMVVLSREGVRRCFRVHCLVADAFIGPLPPGLQRRHWDGNPQNNDVSNLLFGTPTENAADRERHGTTRRGATSPRAKLTSQQVAELRQRHAAAGVGRKRVPRGFIPKLAAEYGLTVNGVSTIVAGRGYP